MSVSPVPSTPLPAGYAVHSGPLDALSGPTWHGISRLRQDVFVVEQECAYPDQDDLDSTPDTVHVWLTHSDGAGTVAHPVVATLRLLTEPDGHTRRIGRVATAVEHRGQGLMAHLFTLTIQECGTAPIVLAAQAHLRSWYERFGFVLDGEGFLEDGIPHVPMRRPSPPAGRLMSRE